MPLPLQSVVHLDLWGEPRAFTVQVPTPSGVYLHHEELPPGATVEEAQACIDTVVQVVNGAIDRAVGPFD